MSESQASLPLAMTMGDPAGIGPELTLRAWLRREEIAAPFFVIADPNALRNLSQRLGLNVSVSSVTPQQAAASFDSALPVVALTTPTAAQPGRPDSTSAAATIESIERAVAAVRLGQASAVVTNPIAKHVLYDAGFRFPGHTEFLGELARPGRRSANAWPPTRRHWRELMPWAWNPVDEKKAS